MDLSRFVVLSTDGTFMAADTCFLVDTTKLTDEQLELLNEGTDSDRFDLTITNGIDLQEVVNADELEELTQ
jgi:hypothetical protein